MLDASEMLIIDTRRFFQFLNKGQKQYQMEIRFCPIIVHYKSRISKYRTLINTRNYTELFNSGIKRLMIVKDMTKKIQENLDDQIDVRKGQGQTSTNSSGRKTGGSPVWKSAAFS